MENFILDYLILIHWISNNLWAPIWYKSEDCSIGYTSSWNIYTDIFWNNFLDRFNTCLLYTSPSPRDVEESRMPSSA